jgi:hypothetical protein
MTMMRLLGRGSAVALALAATVLSSACEASFPVAPTGPVSVEGVRVMVGLSTNLQPSVGSVISLAAYSVNTDRVYAEVTSATTWVPSNPAMVRQLSGGGSFIASAPGPIEFVAVYQGLTDSITFDVVTPPPFAESFPRLTLQMSSPGRIGTTVQARAQLLRTSTTTQDVTDLATWTSSNPDVATVERGRVTSRGIGTVAIRVSYEGLSTASYASVRPGF